MGYFWAILEWKWNLVFVPVDLIEAVEHDVRPWELFEDASKNGIQSSLWKLFLVLTKYAFHLSSLSEVGMVGFFKINLYYH